LSNHRCNWCVTTAYCYLVAYTSYFLTLSAKRQQIVDRSHTIPIQI